MRCALLQNYVVMCNAGGRCHHKARTHTHALQLMQHDRPHAILVDLQPQTRGNTMDKGTLDTLNAPTAVPSVNRPEFLQKPPARSSNPHVAERR